MSIYDDTLNDDACDPDVLRAREAGRDWAEREWEAMESPDPESEWIPTANDARPLIAFSPTDEREGQHERELELAEICNDAARERWESLCESAGVDA